MKIIFIDSYTCVYDTTTYLKMPLGGTQAAVSNLAKLLAQRGHNISVINGVMEPVETDGVRFTCLPCPTEFLNKADVIICVSAAIAQTLRGVGCTKPLVLWTHHAVDQPAISKLQNPEERELFAGIAFVSQWQAATYKNYFGMDLTKSIVMRNAMSPSFQNTQSSHRWLKTGAPPVLGYSSTPFRGLDILLLSFASIRKQIPGTTLRIFSSMGIYSTAIADDYTAFYDLAGSMEGVEYVGALPQPQLAREMAKIDIWSYPCTFPETSCISAMEAMAAGCMLATTGWGALPETTAGFAHMVEFDSVPASGRNATKFANHIVAVAAKAESDSEQTIAMLTRQMEYANMHYNWDGRADEWVAWLRQII